MIYDTNGFGKPNQIGKDVVLLNTNLLYNIKIGNLYVSPTRTTYTPISEAPFMANNNFWAGARDACTAQGMRLPTAAETVVMFNNQATIGITNSFYSSEEIGAGGDEIWYRGNVSGNLWNYPKNVNANLEARCVK